MQIEKRGETRGMILLVSFLFLYRSIPETSVLGYARKTEQGPRKPRKNVFPKTCLIDFIALTY